MNEMNEIALTAVSGGGDLPASSPNIAPTEAAIAAILALLAPRWPVVHVSD